MSEEKCGECAAIGNTLKKRERLDLDDTTQIVGIYGLKCRLTDKWYIGQSVNITKTWHTRYELLHCKNQPKILHALLKYGYEKFDKVILEECSEERLNSRECYWSSVYDSINNGYNTRECGGSRGRHSLETRQKMREKATGRKHTLESIKKMKKIKQEALGGKQAINYGTKHTEESRKKIREARAKQIITRESGDKRSESMKKVWEERRKNGMSKEVGRKITEGKLREWAKRKLKVIDNTTISDSIVDYGITI